MGLNVFSSLFFMGIEWRANAIVRVFSLLYYNNLFCNKSFFVYKFTRSFFQVFFLLINIIFFLGGEIELPFFL